MRSTRLSRLTDVWFLVFEGGRRHLKGMQSAVVLVASSAEQRPVRVQCLSDDTNTLYNCRDH